MGSTYSTRQYSYARESATAAPISMPALASGKVYRFFLGRDPFPAEIDVTGPSDFPADKFWRNVLALGHRPQTLHELRALLDPAFSVLRSFVLGDGSQIPLSTDTVDLAREIRLILAYSDTAQQPDVLVSTAPLADDQLIFLQVVAWDPTHGAYQFYDRRNGSWVWAGSSFEALDDDTRGRGPFDSHINGALNMKELKAPWLHWHSLSASIRESVFDPHDPFVHSDLWINRSKAETFESEIARPGIRRWTASRFAHRTENGQLIRFNEIFRQLVQTTSLNITSSLQESAVVGASVPVTVPTSFFLNRDALFDLLDIAPNIAPIDLDGTLYTQAIRDLDTHLWDGTNPRIEGETHFAFAVPEAAFEDIAVLEQLLARGLISKRFAAALLMVDFCNPIFSSKRAALAQYAPRNLPIGDANALEALVLANIGANSTVPDTGEAGLAETLQAFNGAGNEWSAWCEARIEAFFAKLAATAKTQAGIQSLIRLADSRRREFRLRKLAEFGLTLPFTNVPAAAPFLALTEQGTVVEK